MTKEEVLKNTKDRILEEANRLFARKGFNGTSIREISQAAEVNVAAINYHFNNKENLYWQVFESNYYIIKQGVQECGGRATDTQDLAVEVYRFFSSSENEMMNTFKMFLSDAVTPPEEGFVFEKQENPGPPGQEVFMEQISKDLQAECSEEALKWAVKMIFSLLVHFGVVMNTSMMKKKCQIDPELSPENIEKSLRRSVEAHLLYLRTNKF